jgi:hypothetical protein
MGIVSWIRIILIGWRRVLIPGVISLTSRRIVVWFMVVGRRIDRRNGGPRRRKMGMDVF